MNLLAALNKKYENEMTEEDTDQVDIEALYKKKWIKWSVCIVTLTQKTL